MMKTEQTSITSQVGGHSPLARKVSLFKNAFQTDNPSEIKVDDFLSYIRDGKFKRPIERLRRLKAEDPGKYENEKKKLPGITLSAQLSTRKEGIDLADKLVAHSGFLQADIDKLEDLQAFRKKIDADQYTAFSFVSPGGDGLKVGIRIDPTRHLESYWCVADYFEKAYKVTIDPKVKEVVRLLFVSYDPNVFINPDAKIFPVTSNSNGARPPTRESPTKEDPLNISETQRRHGERALDTARKMISQSIDGEKLYDLLKAGELLGGYVSGGMLTQSEAKAALRTAIEAKPNVRNFNTAYKAIDDSIAHGMRNPISFDELERQKMEYCERMGYRARSTNALPNHPTTHPKEPPRPLIRETPPPEPFPVDALGPLLGDAALIMHDIIQSPLALCCQSVLAAAALAVQPHGNVANDGREHPLSAYFVTVAVSGERKSATDDAALYEHRRWEAELQQRYSRDQANYLNDVEAFKKSKEEALKKAKGYAAKKTAIAELGDPPIAPAIPLLLAQEPTYEGLCKALMASRPSIGIFNDESGTFLNGNALNDENRIKMAAGLSKLWDGKEISRVRAGDGVVEIRNRRVSMHLMAQPKIAEAFLGDSVLIDQGLVSRILAVCPTSTAGSRMYKSKDLSQEPAMRRYYDRMATILRKPLPILAEDDKQLLPPTLKFSPEAKALWIEFHDLIESQLADEQPLAPVRGFANKAPEHALRLAGILTLIENEPSINYTTMANGIELTQHYISEALRLFHSGLTDPQLEQAQKLLEWCQKHEFVYLRKIYQFGPNSIRDAKVAKVAAAILQEHGWLEPVQRGMEIDGTHRRDVWRVISV